MEQNFAQVVQQKVISVLSEVMDKMPNKEVYAVHANINAMDSSKFLIESNEITDYIDTQLEIVLNSPKNTNEFNCLLLFNNSLDTHKTNFSTRANIGKDKGFVMLQVNGVPNLIAQGQMNAAGQLTIPSVASQLFVSMNQKIELEENFNLILAPQDFLIVVSTSLGINQEQNDSVISLIFNEKQKENQMTNLKNILLLFLFISVFLLLVYLIFNRNDKAKENIFD